jgi:hypothetical protein
MTSNPDADDVDEVGEVTGDDDGLIAVLILDVKLRRIGILDDRRVLRGNDVGLDRGCRETNVPKETTAYLAHLYRYLIRAPPPYLHIIQYTPAVAPNIYTHKRTRDRQASRPKRVRHTRCQPCASRRRSVATPVRNEEILRTKRNLRSLCSCLCWLGLLNIDDGAVDGHDACNICKAYGREQHVQVARKPQRAVTTAA